MTNNVNEYTNGVTWVLVADASQADFYSRQKRYSQLELEQSLTEPEARSKEQELTSDAPGRSFDSGGEGRHALEPDQTVKQRLRQNFARRIAGALESARTTDAFQNLVIVASPALLGDLRAQLSSATQKKVVAEISKRMTGRETTVIAALIDDQGG